jgi:hypothetical protein
MSESTWVVTFRREYSSGWWEYTVPRVINSLYIDTTKLPNPPAQLLVSIRRDEPEGSANCAETVPGLPDEAWFALHLDQQHTTDSYCIYGSKETRESSFIVCAYVSEKLLENQPPLRICTRIMKVAPESREQPELSADRERISG